MGAVPTIVLGGTGYVAGELLRLIAGHPRLALAGVLSDGSPGEPVAAWGGVKLLRERFHVEPCLVTGPSTDNQVGVDIITQQMKVPGFNAISSPAALGDAVIEAVGLGARARAVAAAE